MKYFLLMAAPKQGWTWDDFTTVAQRFARRTTSSGDPLIPLSLAWSSYAVSAPSTWMWQVLSR